MPARGKPKRQSGQVVLTLLVLIALGLTMGLLVVSRSTVDIELSSKLEREARVFSANEAGVEDVLINPLYRGDPPRQSTIDDINVAASSLPSLGPGDPFEFPEVVPVGETQTVWLVNHDMSSRNYPLDETRTYTANSIDVCWSKNPNSSTPAIPGLVVSLLYKEGGEYKIARSAYHERPSSPPGSCGTSDQQAGEDCFKRTSSSDPSGNCGGVNLQYRSQINFNSDLGVNPNRGDITLLALRLRPVYDGVQLAVKPPGGGGSGRTLPRQAITDAYVSAQHPDTGESTKIRVFYSFPFAPAVFDYALFSGVGLSHQ